VHVLGEGDQREKERGGKSLFGKDRLMFYFKMPGAEISERELSFLKCHFVALLGGNTRCEIGKRIIFTA